MIRKPWGEPVGLCKALARSFRSRHLAIMKPPLWRSIKLVYQGKAIAPLFRDSIPLALPLGCAYDGDFLEMVEN